MIFLGTFWKRARESTNKLLKKYTNFTTTGWPSSTQHDKGDYLQLPQIFLENACITLYFLFYIIKLIILYSIYFLLNSFRTPPPQKKWFLAEWVCLENSIAPPPPNTPQRHIQSFSLWIKTKRKTLYCIYLFLYTQTEKVSINDNMATTTTYDW